MYFCWYQSCGPSSQYRIIISLSQADIFWNIFTVGKNSVFKEILFLMHLLFLWGIWSLGKMPWRMCLNPNTIYHIISLQVFPTQNCSIIALLHWSLRVSKQCYTITKWYVNLPFKLQFLILWHFEYYSCASKWRCPFWRSRLIVFQQFQLTGEGGPHYHCLYTVDWLVINNKKGMCPSVYILGDFILPLV